MDQVSPLAEKQEAILAVAFSCFAAYGYRRTAMEDIAQAAGMSRSALYLHWRNKEDIFQSLAQRHFVAAAQDMRAALLVRAASAEALEAAFVAKDGKFMELVLTTPHGRELLDAGFELGADIVAQGEAALRAVLAEWLETVSLPESLGTAEEVAESILVALIGLKKTASTFVAYQQGRRRLAQIFARAIS